MQQKNHKTSQQNIFHSLGIFALQTKAAKQFSEND